MKKEVYELASISELRNRGRIAREMVAIQEQRIRAVVANELQRTDLQEDVKQSFASSISSKVSEAVSSTVNQFLDRCAARGLKQSEIRRAVSIVNNAFGIVPENTDYEAMLKGVADYMAEHTSYYDELQIFFVRDDKNV